MTYFSARRRPPQRGDDGFTLVEVLMVVALSAIVTLAISTSVMGSLKLLSEVELNASEGARNQKLFSDFSHKARNLDQLLTATSGSMTFTYRSTSSCEEHTYTFEADSTHPGRYRLRHQISSATLPGLASCSSVVALLDSGNVSPQVNRIEADDLGPNSKFAWLTPAGGAIPRPGDDNYTSQGMPTCRLPMVSLSLERRFYSRDAQAAPDQVENVTVTMLSNVRGLSC